MKIHTSQIDELVTAVNAYGGNFGDPRFVERFIPLELNYDTYVNQQLSPYSDEYYDQQLAIYKEISGRDLNQQDGELHPVDISKLINAANPIGLTTVQDAGEQVRSLSTMLSLSDLSGSPMILDMGAGHGLSSEVFAFTGCNVHAVDIDPALGELSRKRAATRGFNIVRSDLNFDDLSSVVDKSYSAAYFFQSLHHCLRPWELIAQLKDKLTPDGVIGFVGEPINTHWWKHWGIRLDEESLFVARSHGWFESGWSHDFIRDCFARCGMKLKFYSGGYVGGEIGLATQTAMRAEEIAAKARLIGLAERYEVSSVVWTDTRQYVSLIGTPTSILGLHAFEQQKAIDGVLLYGPYITLPAGDYEISIIIRCTQLSDAVVSNLVFDIVHDQGSNCLLRETFAGQLVGDGQIVVRRLTIDSPVQQLEIRAAVSGAGGWSVTLPIIRRI